MNYLDLATLKTLGAPAYFGLGFIQLKINEHQRIHFWVPEWPTIPGADNELHDHRYTLTSTILKGEIHNHIYTPVSTEDPTHELIEVSCKPNSSEEPRVIDRVTPVFLTSFVSKTGDTYTLSPDAFHTAHTVGPTVTFVERADVLKDMARVIRPLDSAFVCPFSIKYSAQECWDKIEEILNA